MRERSSGSIFFLRMRWSRFLFRLIVFFFALPLGCARLPSVPTAPPFSQKEATRLIAHLSEAGGNIMSFQGVGTIMFKKGEEASVSHLLAVGERPYKVRLEMTHSWGKPLFHIVIDRETVSVLSLVEKKLYRGRISPSRAEPFFLVGLDPDSVWKILSGGVPILAHRRALSLRSHEIVLYDAEGEMIEIISFVPEFCVPKTVVFPKKGITLTLSDFRQGDQGLKPLRIRAARKNDNQSFQIQYKSLIFNKPIPKEVFHMDAPPGFEVVELGQGKR
jgi:hypothetical protein